MFTFLNAEMALINGHTDDLKKRIVEHNIRKFDGYNATKLPAVLVFFESFVSIIEPLEAEQKIKTWGRRRKKEALISAGWTRIIALRKARKSNLFFAFAPLHSLRSIEANDPLSYSYFQA